MNLMNLNTGSLDLIFSNEKGFTLLEINPEGRLGLVNNSGCFHLENLQANYIINKIKELNGV